MLSPQLTTRPTYQISPADLLLSSYALKAGITVNEALQILDGHYENIDGRKIGAFLRALTYSFGSLNRFKLAQSMQ